ncbi:DUF1257 domain-containing protein [Cyanobium sp. NIES-981]|uniref:DUF1257 domain-containing protein n=1 Tax=Cyanobium sp. NIES-981 TaxID=1851505 RepID=UPI0007DCE6B1|nr:DUF1257 domain-containing protein [Cyanobium sp. NIES-981]SBO42208.1 conserved protein of unknown function [Cyanobium sp. NIES-981]
MSHLSILPTLFRDPQTLAASLEAVGLVPRWGGDLQGFADVRQAVVLQVRLAGGGALGWRRQSDGSLALVGDLQRLSRSRSLQALLGRLTRGYAARMAVKEAQLHFADTAEGSVHVSVSA